MRARLTLYFPEAASRSVQLDPADDYVIGRAADCGIRCEDDEISRRHARLSAVGDHWQIEDLGSKNGITVDGVLTTEALLDGPAWIAVGTTLIRFEPRSEAQAERERSAIMERRETSLALQRELRPAQGVKPLLEKVLRSVLDLAGADRGFAMLAQPDGDLEVMCCLGVSADRLGQHEFAGSRGAIEQALATRKSVVTADVAQLAALSDRPSIVAGGIRALLSLPMCVLDRTIGVIYADSLKVGKVFTELDVEILEELCEHAATALAVARIDREIADLDLALSAEERTSGIIDPAHLETLRDRIPGYGITLDLPGPPAYDGPAWSEIAIDRSK